MSQGLIDLRPAISGSTNGGIWKYNGNEYPFTISESTPYNIEWENKTPPGHEEIQNRISILAEQFFGECNVEEKLE